MCELSASWAGVLGVLAGWRWADIEAWQCLCSLSCRCSRWWLQFGDTHAAEAQAAARSVVSWTSLLGRKAPIRWPAAASSERWWRWCAGFLSLGVYAALMRACWRRCLGTLLEDSNAMVTLIIATP